MADFLKNAFGGAKPEEPVAQKVDSGKSSCLVPPMRRLACVTDVSIRARDLRSSQTGILTW